MRYFVLISSLALLLLAGCTQASATPAPTVPDDVHTSMPQPPPPVQIPVTATPDPDYVPPQTPWRPVPLPTVSPGEREAAGDTWLYLTAFQNDFVSVVDPVSGHALHWIPVNADQAGMAVSPDGSRLYVVDGLPAQDGLLRIFDTKTRQVIHQEPAPDRLRLLGGNPITLSPDGRWLVAGFYDYDRRLGWNRIFDTETLEFLPDEMWRLEDCGWDPIRLVGQPGDGWVYVQCQGFVAVLSAKDLSPIKRIPSPTPLARDSLGWSKVGIPYLAVSPGGHRLYGLYPRIERKSDGNVVPVVGTDLQLLVWETGTGETIQTVMMSELVSVPLATVGRAHAGYLTVSPDGNRIFMAWEDMLWALDGESLRVLQELRLPAPVDGLINSMDGLELYLLPATAGNLDGEGRGMITVDAANLSLVRHTDDWPRLMTPFFFAASAAKEDSHATELTPPPTAAPTAAPRITNTANGEQTGGPPYGSGVEIGKPYPYTLYTHCGVRSAHLDGRRWIADPILNVDSVNPPRGWGNPIQQGKMELVSVDIARFVSDTGLEAQFRPLPEGTEYPWGPCY